MEWPGYCVAANETVALPIQPELTDEQARYVVDCIAAFVGTQKSPEQAAAQAAVPAGIAAS